MMMINSTKVLKSIRIGCGYFVLNAGLVAAAIADPMNLDVTTFDAPVEIADEEMAEMRGRFVDAGKINYFAVNMTTQWITETGQILGAGLNIGVPVIGMIKNPASSKVSVKSTFKNSADKSNKKAANADRNHQSSSSVKEVSINGLDKIDGVAQGTHVAGDGNTVNNAVRMNVLSRFAQQREASLKEHSPVKTIKKEADNSTQHVSRAGTNSVVTQDGAKLSTQIERNKLGVSVDVPGIGKVVQQIKGGNLNDVNGVLQNVQLAGDLQQVQNLIDLQAVFQAHDGFDPQLQVTPALQSLIDLQLYR